MISRTIVRTKVFQAVYSFHSGSDSNTSRCEKELFLSIERCYDLYHMLIGLMDDLNKLATEKIEIRKNKNYPTAKDLNPSMNFVNNKIILGIKQDDKLSNYIEKRGLSWNEDQDLIGSIYKELEEQEFYKEYQELEECSLNKDLSFVKKILTRVILKSESVQSFLEDRSIYWVDDLDYAVSMVFKTLKGYKNFVNSPLLPIYNSPDIESYAKDLYRRTVSMRINSEFDLSGYIKNWTAERIAVVDTILLEMGVVEFLKFPSIPVKVTINEYVDLSKFYSSASSSSFINGVLDRIQKDLSEEGKIKKVGRGLL